MSSNARIRSSIALLTLVVILGACGSSDNGDDASEVTTTAPAEDTSPTVTEADDAANASEEAETSTPAEEETWVEIFPEIVLTETEPGPRPLLSWSAVGDAALYQLTVLDADGAPYWAWSGTETSVHLGGMENPDAIGAWVFEELSWMVVARDATGAPLGMSRRGQLLP